MNTPLRPIYAQVSEICPPLVGMEITEEWRDIPGHEGNYQVSSLGRVRSLPRPLSKGGVLRPSVSPSGYARVALSREGHAHMWRVNRLVATVFHGPAEPGQVCRHLNGDPSDDRAVNLAWGTAKENVADTVAMGRHHHGSKTHCKRGHPFDEENTHYINASVGPSYRRCVTCSKAYKAQWNARRRALRRSA